MTIRFINYKKNNFPPRSCNDITSDMLRKIESSKPNYAFVVEFPSDGSMPIFHTSTQDAPVLCYRLQNFLDAIYSGKQELNLDE